MATLHINHFYSIFQLRFLKHFGSNDRFSLATPHSPFLKMRSGRHQKMKAKSCIYNLPRIRGGMWLLLSCFRMICSRPWPVADYYWSLPPHVKLVVLVGMLRRWSKGSAYSLPLGTTKAFLYVAVKGSCNRHEALAYP